MKSRILPLLILVCLALGTVVPASAEEPATREIVRIEGTTAVENEILMELGFEIAAARPGEWTDLVVSPSDKDRLARLDYPIVASRQLPVSIPSQYHVYAEMLAALEQYAATYPEITVLEDIGDGWGKIYNDPNNYPAFDIWALKISDNAATDEAEPAILYTGVHHAREPVTVEICLGIAEVLLTEYGTDPVVTAWVDSHETWIVPLVNPDGHWCVTDVNWTDWRKNMRDNDGNGYITEPGWWTYPDGVDNNRNYDWEWGGQGSSGNPSEQTYRGPSPFSEPENQAIRDLAYRENFAFSVDYHSYGELILYPYGYDAVTEAPDDALLREIAEGVESRIQNGYVAAQAHDLYPAAGASLDWHYGAYNSMALLIETATEFIPPGTAIAGIVEENLRGARYIQERADGPGVRGIVRIEGVPGEATVELVGIDDPPLNTIRKSHPIVGDYYRITQPGTWTLRFHVDGYDDQEFEVDVPSDGFVTLDVDFGTPQDVADLDDPSALRFAVGPNPARGEVGFHYALPAGCDEARVRVHDL
ncbi:MAG: hypothetical protein GF346_03595, partial [Candidatus Eisenbacteria bacterium]|nr:hypothetical protein [Candidatus Latescibacterota bacterium]MBD3301507.1 hypothetical protein [Candidatus Eisenbacteria bacterium]